MSEYNRLKLENLSLRRNLVATATDLKRLLAAVDQGLTLEDVGLAVRSVEDLNGHLRTCPPNMCREGHPEVRHSVGEECPACRLDTEHKAHAETTRDRDLLRVAFDNIVGRLADATNAAVRECAKVMCSNCDTDVSVVILRPYGVAHHVITTDRLTPLCDAYKLRHRFPAAFQPAAAPKPEMIECRACSVAGGASRAVFHDPPACETTAPAVERKEDEKP